MIIIGIQRQGDAQLQVGGQTIEGCHRGNRRQPLEKLSSRHIRRQELGAVRVGAAQLGAVQVGAVQLGAAVDRQIVYEVRRVGRTDAAVIVRRYGQ